MKSGIVICGAEDRDLKITKSCEFCGNPTVSDDGSFMYMTGGADLELALNRTASKAYSFLMENGKGYFYLGWHAPTEMAGKLLVANVVRDAPECKFAMFFCSTKCGREFMNAQFDKIDELRNEHLKLWSDWKAHNPE